MVGSSTTFIWLRRGGRETQTTNISLLVYRRGAPVNGMSIICRGKSKRSLAGLAEITPYIRRRVEARRVASKQPRPRVSLTRIGDMLGYH